MLYYATLHEHPLAGGYIGRMPADAADAVRDVAGGGAAAAASPTAPARAFLPAGEPACRYLVVNRAASSAALLAYVASLQAESPCLRRRARPVSAPLIGVVRRLHRSAV